MPRSKKPKPSNRQTELIITEKPAAAEKIASALGPAEKHNLNGVPYYEINKGGKQVLIGCAVGHLFTLKQISGKGWPVFDISWEPNFKVRKRDWSKKYYTALTKLCKQANKFIVACDYDVEGEVIGWNVVRFICGKNKDKTAKRMKFSTLTASELQKAYKELMPSLDFGQAYAGETRHKLDWLYGINLSRALMEAIKTTGSFKIMSIGRVQGPALRLIVEKERAIKSFKPSPYWQVFLLVQDSEKQKVEVKYIKDLTKKSELAKFKLLKNKLADATTKKTEQKILPPAPFDLTTLQTEAYRFHNRTPSQTLQIAQSLYLAGLISYPRTSSQKLPPSISYKEILKKLSKHHKKLTKFIKRKKPIEGRKSDPAHPAIYPTGEHKESLSDDEKKIYNLIVRRFISCFCEDAIVENKKIEVTSDKLKFRAKGLNIKQKGWMDVYTAKLKEENLPDINGKVTIREIRTEEKQTKPPKRYSAASLVRELEKKNLGTKATRANIVETLYSRDYIKEKSIEATPLGISLIESLEKNSPIIIDDSLTRNFEKQMNTIQGSKKDLPKKSEKIIESAKDALLKIEKQFRKNEAKIGKQLVKSITNIRETQRKANTLNICPKCGKGNLHILFNRKSKRYFVACNAYPKCKNTFSLPPNSLIKPATDSDKQPETCQECQFPKLIALRKGKRPWKFCFNPQCPTNEEWAKKREENANNKEQTGSKEKSD